MKLKIYFLLLAFILNINFFHSTAYTFDLFKAFKKNQVKNPSFSSSQTTNLQVESYSPIGELKDFRTSEPAGVNVEIFIKFNQPMVALEDLDKQKERVQLVFNPPLKGEYKWEGTDSLSFRPYFLPKASAITVTIPAGTKSLKGRKLESPFSWEFETERPDIKQSYPYHNSDQFGPTNQIFLYFTMPMRKEDVQKFITLKYRYLILPIAYIYKIFNESFTNDTGVETNYIINLKPKDKLKIDTSYSIVIKKDFKSELGDLGTKKEIVINFKTYPKLNYKGKSAYFIRPGESVTLEFSNPVSLLNILSNSIISGCTNQIPINESDIYETKTPYFYFNDHPQSQLFIKMTKNIKDIYNNPLQNPQTIQINIGDYYPYFWTTYGTGFIESYMSGTLPIKGMNIKSFTMLYEPIKNKDKIIHWDQIYSGQDTQFTYEKTFTVPMKHNVEIDTNIPIKSLVGSEKGILAYRFEDYLESGYSYLSGLLQFTELGLTCKFTPFQNLILVTKLKDSTPVENADVEIRSTNNNVLFHGKTDNQGLLITPGWYKMNLTTWQNFYVMVEKDKDLIYAKNTMLSGINPFQCMTAFNLSDDFYGYYDVFQFSKYYKDYWDYYESDNNGGVNSKAYPPNYHIFVFTERGLYRPGEEVQVKLIGKYFEDNGWSAAANIPVQMTINNSRDKEIFRQDFTLNQFGSSTYNLKLDKESPTGFYSITIKNTNLKISDSINFQVEEFKTANFEVIPYVAEDSFIAGDKFKGTIKGWYLFGAPMEYSACNYKIELQPYYMNFSDFPGFCFDDINTTAKEKVISRESGKLNKQGLFSANAVISPNDVAHTMRVFFEGTITDADRQSLSGSVSRIVHPGEFYIGIKQDDIFFEKNKPALFRLISITPDQKQRQDDKVKVNITYIKWNNVREIDSGGRFHWRIEKITTNVFEKNYTTSLDKNGVEASFLPDKTGFYNLTATGKDKRNNTITSSIYFYVLGSDYVPWAARDDDMIEIVADKKRYKPGDTIKLLVKSPYEKCKALITVEREGILDYSIKEFNTSTPTIELPVKDEYLPNIYVSVILIKGRTYFADPSLDPKGKLGKPGFKIGYINLPVDPGEMKLKVNISGLKQKYMPGDTVECDIKARDVKENGSECEYTVAVVDEGILNLIAYQTPNPFDFFYGSRPLYVSTVETRNYVIEQRNFGQKGQNAGGGGGGKGKSGINFRSKFIPTAYFEPSLISDKQGNAKVKFILPDNLTTFKVMVVANTKTGYVGSAENEFIVNKNILLKESLPMFVRPGDTFSAGIVIHNLSGKDGDINITTKGNNVILKSATEKKIFLKNGESQEVPFLWEINNIGNIDFYFTAEKGNDKDALKISLESKNPRSTETVALYDSTESNAYQTIKIPENYFPDTGGIKMTGASTGLAGLTGVLNYLEIYPYDCLEQRASKVIPFILSKQILMDFKIINFTSDEINKRIQEFLNIIPQYQSENGGYCYWTDRYYASPYLTCYVCFAMLKAKEKGYTIDETSFANAIQYLQKIESDNKPDWGYPYKEYAESLMSCFVSYILALAGQPDEGLVNNLYDIRDKIPFFGQAMLLKTCALLNKTAQARDLANMLMNKMDVTSTTAHLEQTHLEYLYSVHDSNIRATAIALQALIDADINIPYMQKILRWFVLQQKMGYYQSTQDNIFVFYALATFYDKFEKTTPNFTSIIKTATKELFNEKFIGFENRTITHEYPISTFKPGETLDLTVNKQGEGRFYYGMQLTYAPKGNLPAKNEGFVIKRNILDFDTKKPVTGDFKAGQKYIISLDVSMPVERNFIMLEDQLPAGFQVINTSFATTSSDIQDKLNSGEYNEYWWYGIFDHYEYYKDRVMVFADWLGPGTQKVQYAVKAVTPGTFTLPSAKVEEMYNPDVFGRTEQAVIKIGE